MTPSLNDYESQMDDDGFVLNKDSIGLPFVDVTKYTGLDNAPFRLTQHDHEGVDGGYVDSEFMTTRTVTIEGTAYVDPSNPDALFDVLKRNFRPSKLARPFYFKSPGVGVRKLFGKAQGIRYDVDAARRIGKTDVVATVLCGDPYIYDSDQIVAFGFVGAPDPGFGFNLAFNFGFGGAGTTSNKITLYNAGNHDAFPIISITGPLTQPYIVESTSGNQLAFNLTLGPTDTLVIDTRKHSTKIRSANVRSSLAAGSQWFTVPAQSSSDISLYGDLGSATGTMTANAAGTTSTIKGTDADAADINIGDMFRLYTSTGALKEPTVFQVTSKSSVSGTTTIGFTPNAAVATASTDFMKAGIATFNASINSTWY